MRSVRRVALPVLLNIPTVSNARDAMWSMGVLRLESKRIDSDAAVSAHPKHTRHSHDRVRGPDSFSHVLSGIERS